MAYFIIIILIFLITFAYGSLRGAPWVPTITEDIERILKIADIKKGDIFYDLGFGNGKVLFAAHKKGAIVKGYELALLPYLLAQIKVMFLKNKKNISFKYRDFWHENVKDADIVYVFLTPKHMPKLGRKLKKELKPGSKIISYVFPIPDWEEKINDEQPGKTNIYLYIV